jgi:hypothetical protein
MTDTTQQAVVETPAHDANTAEQVVPPESSTGAVDTSDKSEKQPKGDAIQKRIDKLTWQLRQTERERDFEREQRLATLQRNAEPQPKQSEARQPLKKLADFEYDEERYAEYVAEVAADRAAQKLEQTRTTKESERTRKEQIAKFKELESKFKTEIEDYEDVAYYARIDEHVANLVMAMDEGPRVAYYLGKNPDVAARINSLPDNLAAVELGRIDAKLAIEREQAKAKPVSKAPPPPPKIDATEPAVEKDPSQMTDAEFAKWRKRQIAQRR